LRFRSTARLRWRGDGWLRQTGRREPLLGCGRVVALKCLGPP
jgi:hypothetical protein